jgi:hypothetical protein
MYKDDNSTAVKTKHVASCKRRQIRWRNTMLSYLSASRLRAPQIPCLLKELEEKRMDGCETILK